MKSVPSAISDSDLQAYVDGRLSAEQRADFERSMSELPEVAERVAVYSQQREALRVALQDKFNEPIPAHLRVDHIAGVLTATRRKRGPALAAAAAWLLVGGAVGSLTTLQVAALSASSSSSSSASQTHIASRPMADALSAHRVYVADVRHPVEVGADERAHLQTWLSKRVGRELKAPDLSVAGYELLGGRLLSASSGPAALFMYENDSGARMTVYVRSSDKKEAPVKLIDDRGLRAAYWYDDGFGFAVSAEDNRETVIQAAQTAQRQLRI